MSTLRKSMPGLLVLAVLAVLLSLFIERRDAPTRKTEASRASTRPEGFHLDASPPPSSVRGATGSTMHEQHAGSLAGSAAAAPLAASMDPEKQPRAWLARNFTAGDRLTGFELTNVLQTERGIELPPLEPGADSKPRFGVIESPTQVMAFPSNAISPLWLEQLPQRTDMVVELAMSPDGVTWTDWMVTGPDADSVGQQSEYMPDGSRNPSYGYTPGGVTSWGLDWWGYFRYRVTLYSETDQTPILQGMRFLYQDSTLGQGRRVDPSRVQLYAQENSQ